MNPLFPVAQGHAALRPVMHRRLSFRRRPLRGFTLVEMLVALAITLIMMGAVVTLFGVISESVSGSRAAIELSNRLRAARNQLQLDLQGATATMRPPLRPENDEGYLEIIEGQLSDKSFVGGADLFGDVDDVLMFTTRSRVAPFAGRYLEPPLPGTRRIIESPVAEVVYFLVQNGPVIDARTATPTRLCTLYRRVLLVAPALGTILPEPAPDFYDHFYDENDISVRYDLAMQRLVANTLGDLTKRENRFAHYGSNSPSVNYQTFPFPVDLLALPQNPPVAFAVPSKPPSWPAIPPLPPSSPLPPEENAFLAPLDHERIGDDVLLTNVLAFDVQVWDAGAPLLIPAGSSVAVEPRDPGWTGIETFAGSGAYVDLGYDDSLQYVYPPAGISPQPPAPVFRELNPNARPSTVAFPTTTPGVGVYDTWSLHYENDGVDQNGSGTDTGTNGLDDGGIAGVVDDIDEYDTQPPYTAPLRGIRITIRVYEPDSQQVREAVVIQDFLPD